MCPKGHEYDSKILNRTKKDKPSGCPYCSRQKVSNGNNLKFLFPKIADEWHPSKNGELKPEDFTHGSNKKICWLCPKGHSYESIIKDRTRKEKSGCPLCYKDRRNSS